MHEYIAIMDASNGHLVVRSMFGKSVEAEEVAEQIAKEEGLSFGDCNWQIISSLDVRF